jgi:uncharacterized protein YhfF
MTLGNRTELYWHTYLATLSDVSPLSREQYVAEQFGDSAELANELGALIVSGAKTATCSAVWEWEVEGKAVPQIGLKTIVLDGSGEPLCIIETTEVRILPFDEVDAAFAKEEGEGDPSLEYWREAHWRFFSRALPKIGREADRRMPLVCERFRVLYRG